MSHSSRKDPKDAQQQPEGFFDDCLVKQCHSHQIVRNILEEILTEGAFRLHNKYLQSQIKPYASKTLSKELVMNASWANQPLSNNDIIAEYDDDLELPPIDEWAGGVLPVRGKEDAGLRSSVAPNRDPPKPPNNKPRIIENKNQKLGSSLDTRRTTGSSVYKPSTTQRSRSQKESKKPKPKPAEPEAVIIARQFEEAKKKTGMSMKAVTVDSDFSVIQINEPKNLPPTLIVPKVSTKKATHIESAPKQQTRPTRKNVVVRTDSKQRKKKQLPKLIEPDSPIFDEEITQVSYSEKVVCEPGVTIRDGSVVKSRAQVGNPNQMTRSQYQAYLEDMMKNG